jgi:DnaK suppressor protein
METRKQTPRHRKPKAATEDVLGIAAKPLRINPKWRKQYDRLVELRDHLTSRRTNLSNDALSEQPTFSSHMADAATDTYDRDFALGMLSSEQDAIYQIEQAIDRIHNGTYGICELTGKPIEAARLDAVPWARFGAVAEKQLEREGARKRTRLGARHSVAREPAAKDPEEA